MRTGLLTALVFLTALVLASLPAPALAQISAPSMVDDEDLPPQEAANPPPAVEPGATVREVVREPAAPKAREPAPVPAAGGPSAPEKTGSEKLPAEKPATAAAPVPGAPPGGSAAVTPPDELKTLQRPIEPVRTSHARLLELWQSWRTALREQDAPKARGSRERMVAAARELGIENLIPFAVAEVREVERSLAARLSDDAMEHATFAVELAPDLADAHFALARARLAHEPGRPVAILAEVGAALAAGIREPHSVRALYGDLCGAGLAALYAAAALSILILFARRLRLFLHDFHHLPLLRGGAPAQASVLALVLVALPVAFRLGPFPALAAVTAAAWLYLSRWERAVATAALLSLVALPSLAGSAARLAAWNGTLGEEVFDLEHGGPAGPTAAEALARAASEELPAPALMALGRHLKRRGELDAALRLYDRAAAADGDGRGGEVQVNIGNVRFLQGDLEGAKAAYLAATDRAGTNVTTLAAAHYDLSKLYLRLSALEQSQEARKKAQQEDRAFLERYGSDEDFRANRYLVDVPVPMEQIEALAAGNAARDLSETVRARVAGAVPAPLWPAAPLLFVAALWGAALLSRRMEPARACDRCGRPACRRCDGIAAVLCGQCVNVFMRKGIVDARDRRRKEQGVRRHAQWARFVTRALAILGGGAGHLYAGEPMRGFVLLLPLLFFGFVLWFWRGLLPPPQPSPYAAAAKLAVAVPLGISLYALVVRDVFRRSRG